MAPLTLRRPAGDWRTSSETTTAHPRASQVECGVTSVASASTLGFIVTSTTVRRVFLWTVGCIVLALLGGCSSTSSSDATASPTPTHGTPSSSVPVGVTTSGSSSTSPAMGQCTEASILAALPAGSTMDKYDCAIASPSMWAAARVKPGATVFFLEAKAGAWKVYTANKICQASSPRPPKEILAFCPKA